MTHSLTRFYVWHDMTRFYVTCCYVWHDAFIGGRDAVPLSDGTSSSSFWGTRWSSRVSEHPIVALVSLKCQLLMALAHRVSAAEALVNQVECLSIPSVARVSLRCHVLMADSFLCHVSLCINGGALYSCVSWLDHEQSGASPGYNHLSTQ